MRFLFIGALLVIKSIFPVAAAKIQGYFISKDGQRIEVQFRVPVVSKIGDLDLEEIQWGLTYWNEDGKHFLTHDEAIEFGFSYQGQSFRFLSRSIPHSIVWTNIEKPRKVFLQLIDDGDLRLFRYYRFHGIFTDDPFMSSHQRDELFIIQKGAEEIFPVRWRHFSPEMIDYLKDCPEFLDKIKQHNVRVSDIAGLVSKHNKLCHHNDLED
jgi:hypothetical protein